QQEQRDRRLVADGKKTGAGCQGKGSHQRGHRGAHGKHLEADDVDQPAHGAGKAAGQVMAGGDAEGDAETDGGDDGHQKLDRGVHGKGIYHNSTPSPRAASQPSTTPQARLPAMSTASSRRIAPER